MDAMTNVVGILLLILIVSSLGITAAVKEIMENMPEISQEQLEAMRTSRKKTLDNLEDLRATKANVEENTLEPDEAQQLALALDKFEKENEDLAEKTSDLDELLAKSKELEPVKDEKEERNTKAVKELNDLEAALAAKPLREIKAAREITLPDPRPADSEAYVYYVACKHQKLYIIGEPYELMIKMRDILDQNFTSLVYQGEELGNRTFTLYTTKLDDNDRPIPFKADYQARTKRAQEALAYMKPVKVSTLSVPEGRSMYEWIFGKTEEQQESKKELAVRKLRLDRGKVQAFFKNASGKGDFSFTPTFAGDGVIKIGLTPNPEKGLTEEQFLSGDSAFVQLVKKASVNRRVILMYFVASDSFETYLRARDYSTSQRIAAGWQLWEGTTIPDLVPNKLREAIPYDLEGLPETDYLKLAKFVGPKVAPKGNALVGSFETDLAAVKVPEELKDEELKTYTEELKTERERWVNGLYGELKALYESPLAASEVRGREDVLVQNHPPNVPHVRVFNPKGKPPSAPRPKGTPRPKGKGKGKPTLILD